MTRKSKETAPNPTAAKALRAALDLHKNGNPAAAIPLYKQAISIFPENGQMCCLLGVALKETGELDSAIHILEKAVELDPLRPDFLAELGIAFGGTGNAKKAVECLREAVPKLIALGKDDFLTLSVFGDNCFALGLWEEAIEQYRSALNKKAPSLSVSLNIQLNIGVALHHLEKTACAIKTYETILSVDPVHAGALTNLGVAYQENKIFDKSLELLLAAAKLIPNDPLILTDLGVTLTKLNKTDEAIENLNLALNESPNYSKAWSNLGNALQSKNKFTEAWEAHHRAIILEPDNPDFHWNLAMTLLSAGEYEQGWQEYEWRRQKHKLSNFPQALEWKGEPIFGKTIFLEAEQGAGDAIQFSRYATLIEAEGAKVILRAHTSLKELFQTLGQNITVLQPSDPVPICDFHTYLISVPYLLKQELENLPSFQSYLSVPSNSEVRLPSNHARKIRVGVAWYGNRRHANDHNRSCRFSDIKPLLELEKIEWVSLQKEPVSEQKREIVDLSGQIKSFADTAAIINQLDLVISVDTAVAHLAGALGKTVWVMLPFASDWRWLTERADSPWYPTARLYRQKSPGDWHSVITSIKSDLN